MTKFLIQFENNIPAYDFCYETIKSIEYHNWLENKKEYKYTFCNLSKLDILLETKETKYHLEIALDINNRILNRIPIGSVEFVHKYMELCNIPIPKPINIPEELFSLCIQEPQNIILNGQNYTYYPEKEFYIKSNNKIKNEFNGKYTNFRKVFNDSSWQVTKPIDILSEWRCFIFKEKVVGVYCYSGSQWIMPSALYIDDCIKIYKSAPVAYTLDIAVTDEEGEDIPVNTVIECHNFYSCGFYGFSGKYPVLMHSAWWKEYLKNAGIN